MKISVDETKCCGAGQCALIAPDVFDQRDDDGIVTLLNPEPPQNQHPTVREAAAVCPAAAITLDGHMNTTGTPRSRPSPTLSRTTGRALPDR